jgi:hypothetical protein
MNDDAPHTSVRFLKETIDPPMVLSPHEKALLKCFVPHASIFERFSRSLVYPSSTWSGSMQAPK